MSTMGTFETGSGGQDESKNLNMIGVTDKSSEKLNGVLSHLSQDEIEIYLDYLKDPESSINDVITAIQTLKSDQNGSEQIKKLILSLEQINKLISYIKNPNNSIGNMITVIQTLKSDINGSKELEKTLKNFFGLKDENYKKLKSELVSLEKKKQEKEKLPELIKKLKETKNKLNENEKIYYEFKGDNSTTGKKFWNMACELIKLYEIDIEKLNKQIEDLKKGEPLEKIKNRIKVLQELIANYEVKSQLLCELFFLEKLWLEERKDKDQQAYNDFANKFIRDFKNLQCKTDLDIISNWPRDFKDKYEKILKELGWKYFDEYQKKIENIKNKIRENKELEFIILPDSRKILTKEDELEIDRIDAEIFNTSNDSFISKLKECNDYAGISGIIDRDTTNFLDLFGGVLGLGSNYGFWTQQDKNWPINSNKTLEKRRFDAIKTFLLIKGTEVPLINENELEKYIFKRVFFADEGYASDVEKKKIAKYCLEREGNNSEIIKLVELDDFIDKFYEEINTIFREGEKPDIMDILKLAVKNAQKSKDGEKLLNILTTPFCIVNDTPFKYYLDFEFKKEEEKEKEKKDFKAYIYDHPNDVIDIYNYLSKTIGKSFKKGDTNRFYETCINGEVIRLSGKARLIIKYKNGRAYIRHYVSPKEHGEDGHGPEYSRWLENVEY